MTTTGYGDMTPDRGNAGDIIIAMMLMLSASSRPASSSAVAASIADPGAICAHAGAAPDPPYAATSSILRGLAASGRGVIDLLLGFGAGPLVVVERTLDPAMIERGGGPRASTC